jgi:hypothetical protein
MPAKTAKTGSRHHNTTRKKKFSATTLPELKGTFDALRKSTHEILRSTKETKQRIKKFQAVWRDLFHRPVDAVAAEAYLRVMDKGTRSLNGHTAKSKQKGGALSGAPLDFQTRPGIDGVHGSFPQYLTGGLSFYNTINQEGMFKDCGTQDITPAVPYDMGSNKVGGGVLGDAATFATTRLVDSSVPASAIQDARNMWQGRTLGASPNASQNPLKYI